MGSDCFKCTSCRKKKHTMHNIQAPTTYLHSDNCAQLSSPSPPSSQREEGVVNLPSRNGFRAPPRQPASQGGTYFSCPGSTSVGNTSCGSGYNNCVLPCIVPFIPTEAPLQALEPRRNPCPKAPARTVQTFCNWAKRQGRTNRKQAPTVSLWRLEPEDRPGGSG